MIKVVIEVQKISPSHSILAQYAPGVELGRGPGTLSVQAGQTCVGVCAGADVDACVDVGGCPHGRTELSLAPEGQRAPGQPKTCDSIPLAEFLDL